MYKEAPSQGQCGSAFKDKLAWKENVTSTVVATKFACKITSQDPRPHVFIAKEDDLDSAGSLHATHVQAFSM